MSDKEEITYAGLKLFQLERTEDGKTTDVKLWAKDWEDAERVAEFNGWKVIGMVVPL